MLKIFGLLLLIGSMLIFLVGLGVTLRGFWLGSGGGLACQLAEKELKKVDEAAQRYELAKGTSREVTAKRELDVAIAAANGWSNTCKEAKDSFRFSRVIFAVVGFVGLIGLLVGGVLTIVGFRKKKLA